MKDTVAFWGYPHPLIIKQAKKEYKNARWLDLDVDYHAPDCFIAPENYCCIIKNILNNAFFYKDRIIKILSPAGRDKCDSAIFTIEILKNYGFEIETSVFEEKTYKKDYAPISESNLPLRKKTELITRNIIDEKDFSSLVKVKPKAGFWGVAPNDLSILELFPDETHIFGWLRCVEKCAPFDIEEEMHVPAGIKTVFFAQTFCAKNQLAKFLADKYGGLYIDVDGHSTNSTKAKIEAFLRLNL